MADDKWLTEHAKKVEQEAEEITRYVAELTESIRSGARKSKHRFRL